MKNYEYGIGDLYPNMSVANTRMDTVVQPDEQEVLANVDPENKVAPSVNSGTKIGVWGFVGIILVLVVFFHLGR